MSAPPQELRDLIESGPLAHVNTVNEDGTPLVTVVWIGLDGDDLVSGERRTQRRHLGPPQPPGEGLHRPEAEFPAPKGAGYILRYPIERIGGVGPWAQT
jgi:hypothetical protein